MIDIDKLITRFHHISYITDGDEAAIFYRVLMGNQPSIYGIVSKCPGDWLLEGNLLSDILGNLMDYHNLMRKYIVNILW